jgi:23S rRNA (guanine2445-N2)-methyltransferase / 23S rRNA (guanine2069-N7)-methyltransferase
MASEQYSFYATSAKGMEVLLSDEISKMGATSVGLGRAGVSFRGPLEMGYRVCLWSRIANRVLLPLKTFPAPDPDRLYGGVRSIHWKDHLTIQDTLAVDFSSSHSQITHNHFGALKVKDAIVDQFRTTQGERPSVDPANPDIRINVYLHEDVATVSIDLSGESLHRRGYRQEGVEAPLKENLAAALLTIAGWPKKDSSAFLDPMCGSGTLPIEAALMSANIAPGIFRKRFGFEGWQGHVPALWKRLVSEAKELEIKDKKKLPKIVGYDADFRVVRIALANGENAGLQGRVHIEKRDFANCKAIADSGVILLNPPYGERLGDVDQLKVLYRAIGDTFKQKFKGWNGYVFTGSSVLSKVIGLKAAQRTVLYNGAIECRLLKYDLY